MALLTSELERCKAELGYPLVSINQPYITEATSIFEQAVAPFLSAGATTTSATAVVGDGTPKSLTLALATGFSSGARVVVDVDGRQETVTVQALSGTTLTALFAKTHSGSYPVTVEGGETMVREKLGEIWTARVTRGQAQGAGALKEITGDVGWYDSKLSAFASSDAEIATLRDELAMLLGVENLWNRKKSAGSRLSVY